MKKVFYRRWNWELDVGIDQIPEGHPLPPKYAIAFYDHKDRLFRVELRQEVRTGNDLRQSARTEVCRYDYFCDADGMVLQKRSLGDDNEVVLIVDYEYDSHRDRLRETAWSPESGACNSIERSFKSRERNTQ